MKINMTHLIYFVLGGMILIGASAHAEHVLTDFYAESYQNNFVKDYTHFQRFQFEFDERRIDIAPGYEARPYLGLENYQSADLPNSARTDLGLKAALTNKIQSQVALRRQSWNNPELADWEILAGVVGGDSWILEPKNLFAEAYAEIFWFFPTKNQSYGTGFGSAKVGYRWYEQNQMIVDPLVVDARLSENTSRELAGPDSKILNIGPRFTFWWAQPELSASLFAARSWASSRSDVQQQNDYWILLSFGVRF